MQFLLDPDDLAREVRLALDEARSRVAAFVAASDNGVETLRSFDRIGAPLNPVYGQVQLFSAVHPDKRMRDVCEELEREISSFRTSLRLNRGVFDRLVEVELGSDADPLERRFLEHTLRDFRRAGVDRDESVREEIRRLEEEIIEVGQEFDRNIVKGARELVLEEGHAALAGVPDDFLATHPEREDGSVVVTTDVNDRVAILTYAEDEDVRRRYFQEVGKRACPENLEVLPRLLDLRHRLAQVLGFDSFADYIAGDKMAKSAEGIRSFLERVRALVEDAAGEEHGELLAEKRALGTDDEVVREYDRAFLTERLRRRKHAFDSQAVRPYFPFESVKRGVLETSERLFGVEIVPNHEFELWHDSVEAFDVLENGEPIARFFLDMHPREDKYKHAAMFDLCVGDGEELPAAILVCNMPQPTEDDPALLLHEDVTTIFHEFGHLLHHLFGGRQRFLGFSGIATEFDFVEVPSQLFEEWPWYPEVLATFAHHYETGEAIPAELIERMREAESCGRATWVLGQLYFASLSLSFYDRDPTGLDTDEHMIELKRRMLPTPHEPGTHFQAAFGHLNGYSALYYTYMWSLVIVKDLLSAFGTDRMDAATARRYRECILTPGGARDAEEMIRAFLGREGSFDAFERWVTG